LLGAIVLRASSPLLLLLPCSAGGGGDGAQNVRPCHESSALAAWLIVLYLLRKGVELYVIAEIMQQMQHSHAACVLCVLQLEEVVTVHKKHTSALEKALRCLDNDAITSEEIDPLKDDLDYYIVSLGGGCTSLQGGCSLVGYVLLCAV
jgi:DNA-binding transcriptional MerR regulator